MRQQERLQFAGTGFPVTACGMTEKIGQRLKRARDALGIGLPTIAKKVGVKTTTLQDLENGRSNGTKHILALAEAVGQDPQWLLSGKGEFIEPAGKHLRDEDTPEAPDISSIVTIGRTEFARLPVYDIRAAAGNGAAVTHEAPIDWQLWNLSALRSLTASPLEEIDILRVTGDSMENELHDGDYIFIDRRKRRLGNPGIFVLNVEGDLIVKRASMNIETRAVTLRSDNARYPEMVIKKPENLVVIGRVFLVIKRK